MSGVSLDEVEFDVRVERCRLPVRGNVVAVDGPADDRAAEDRILERLERGDRLAWCDVYVTATVPGFAGWDSAGCLSLRDEDEVRSVIEDRDMEERALADLVEGIEAAGE